MNPYFIKGPALLSFSGGRTSAYMLWKIRQAHGGTLPADIIVTFANTGKERIETLDFVQRCATEWGIHVVWLEWADNEEGFVIVSHNSAARNGEPFEALITKKKMLPNSVMRFWRAQNFDLQLQDWEENCDHCFLKGQAKQKRICQDSPNLIGWWIEQEKRAVAGDGSAGTFRPADRSNYSQMEMWVRRNPRLPGLDVDPPEFEFDDDTACGEGYCG